MNVANALAAAAAAWAAGAHLHDIRQGLRTFTTSFFQAPGRLNSLQVKGFEVLIDYCHNVDGMRRLGEFVDLTVTGATPGRLNGSSSNGSSADASTSTPAPRPRRAIGVIGIPGDRRDDDQRKYGEVAARSFDHLIIREDTNLRGRKPGETAAHVREGVERAQASGARCQSVELVLKELDAALAGLRMGQPGDLVVICADDTAAVYREAMALGRAPGEGMAIIHPGEYDIPEG
jgi:cyanophycin synthetase